MEEVSAGTNETHSASESISVRQRFGSLSSLQAVWMLALILAYGIYVIGIWQNPPGFYLDESALSYNAYLVSQTGAGEFGQKFPLYFQVYTGGFTQYANPTHIYLLALLFSVFGPGILTARLFAAACVFTACVLLGALANRISGNRIVGVAVGIASLSTPWLFEVGRLVLETFFYPLATVLLLWSVYRVRDEAKWNWVDISTIALSLTLLTYSYTIGRLFGPLLAGGLILFAANKERAKSVAKVWGIYAVTLIPLAVFIFQNPELTTRFRLLSYIKPESTYGEIFVTFVGRFFQDINPIRMLLTGDINQRHHLPDALGSFYLSVFILAVVGLAIVIVKYRREAWWRYVVFGLAASVVPGALTVDQFHTLRMIAYPVFLLLLTVPALEWLFSREDVNVNMENRKHDENRRKKRTGVRKAALPLLLLLFVAETSYFHTKNIQKGPQRGYVFDTAYKDLYDSAVSLPGRPIYLVDDYWGPAYIHAFWYATLEGRDTKEFIHLPYGARPPAGSLVLSSERGCSNCVLLEKKGDYLLYLSR